MHQYTQVVDTWLHLQMSRPGDIGQASAAKPIDMQSLYILRAALFESGFDSVVFAQLWPLGPVFPFLLVDGLCETWTCKRAIYNHTRTPAPESG